MTVVKLTYILFYFVYFGELKIFTFAPYEYINTLRVILNYFKKYKVTKNIFQIIIYFIKNTIIAFFGNVKRIPVSYFERKKIVEEQFRSLGG